MKFIIIFAILALSLLQVITFETSPGFLRESAGRQLAVCSNYETTFEYDIEQDAYVRSGKFKKKKYGDKEELVVWNHDKKKNDHETLIEIPLPEIAKLATVFDNFLQIRLFLWSAEQTQNRNGEYPTITVYLVKHEEGEEFDEDKIKYNNSLDWENEGILTEQQVNKEGWIAFNISDILEKNDLLYTEKLVVRLQNNFIYNKFDVYFNSSENDYNNPYVQFRITDHSQLKKLCTDFDHILTTYDFCECK